jgi:C4-dicarboxylate-binding protein DctP
VTTGPVGRELLASLSRNGLVGLGLVPDEMRRILARRPVLSASDFHGARIRVVTSPTSVRMFQALGAIPLTSFTSDQVGPALASGRLDGIETSTQSIETTATSGRPDT